MIVYEYGYYDIVNIMYTLRYQLQRSAKIQILQNRRVFVSSSRDDLPGVAFRNFLSFAAIRRCHPALSQLMSVSPASMT